MGIGGVENLSFFFKKFAKFPWKFYGLVLGLVELIDAKGIDMAQLIWSWGCPTKAQKQAKNVFFVF